MLSFIGFGCQSKNQGISKVHKGEIPKTIREAENSQKPAILTGSRLDTSGMAPMSMTSRQKTDQSPKVVRIDPRTVQEIGVKTVTVVRRNLERHIRTVGRIAYDEKLVRDVSPKVSGWVEKQLVNFPGQMVRKGDPLGEIYSPELVTTQEEYLNALKYKGSLKGSLLEDAKSGAQDLVNSVETRLRYWDISEKQIKDLRKRGKIRKLMILRAPFTGIVVKKNVFEGGYVKSGESMYRMADISKIWVYADIYEYEAPWVSTGQPATMTLSYNPGHTFTGRVIYVYPYLKKKTRTLEVRMEIENGPNFPLKPGMWANVEIESSPIKNVLVIPVGAVLRTGKRDVAILALGGGHFLSRRIRLGIQAGNYFEVLNGLEEGDRVVSSAEFLINSESSLESTLNKMTMPMKMQSGGTNPLHSRRDH